MVSYQRFVFLTVKKESENSSLLVRKQAHSRSLIIFFPAYFFTERLIINHVLKHRFILQNLSTINYLTLSN